MHTALQNVLSWMASSQFAVWGLPIVKRAFLSYLSSSRQQTAPFQHMTSCSQVLLTSHSYIKNKKHTQTGSYFPSPVTSALRPGKSVTQTQENTLLVSPTAMKDPPGLALDILINPLGWIVGTTSSLFFREFECLSASKWR